MKNQMVRTARSWTWSEKASSPGDLLHCFLGGLLRSRPGWHNAFHACIGNRLSEMLVHVRQEAQEDTSHSHLLPEKVHHVFQVGVRHAAD